MMAPQAGMSAPKAALAEPDRAAAIEAALRGAAPGDWLLLAGKGHETMQDLGSRQLPFDDAAAARLSLRRLEEEA